MKSIIMVVMFAGVLSLMPGCKNEKLTCAEIEKILNADEADRSALEEAIKEKRKHDAQGIYDKLLENNKKLSKIGEMKCGDKTYTGAHYKNVVEKNLAQKKAEIDALP